MARPRMDTLYRIPPPPRHTLFIHYCSPPTINIASPHPNAPPTPKVLSQHPHHCTLYHM
ncbi:hypothetical protein FIBSPDRAFT_847369, partial [Athelia psychrophila]